VNLDLRDFEHAYEREGNQMRMKAKATKGNETQRNATKCNEMQRNATKCNEMQRIATKCNEMQRNAQVPRARLKNYPIVWISECRSVRSCVRDKCLSVTSVCQSCAKLCESQVSVCHKCLSVTSVCQSQVSVCHKCLSVTSVCQ